MLVNFDYRQVVQLVYADQLGGKHAAIVKRYANLRCAVNHVVVGNNVAVG